jgi:hypothetical protein
MKQESMLSCLDVIILLSGNGSKLDHYYLEGRC